jgi:two-component system chemotaxis response regulator CheB
MLPRLPSDFPCPIVIVQHMPPMFTKSLADDLDRHCAIAVREAEQGQPLCAGTALVAPGGKQMKVVASASGPVVQLTDDAPERNCRPSVDYLFRSLAELYGARTLGVVMTGMGDDGTEGCRLLANRNASLIAQDAASCVVYGMPKSVVEAGYIEQVVPLSGMAAEICRIADIGRNR